jgi:hypothetical protein
LIETRILATVPEMLYDVKLMPVGLLPFMVTGVLVGVYVYPNPDGVTPVRETGEAVLPVNIGHGVRACCTCQGDRRAH